MPGLVAVDFTSCLKYPSDLFKNISSDFVGDLCHSHQLVVCKKILSLPFEDDSLDPRAITL